MSFPKLFVITIVLGVATRAAPQVTYWPDYFCPVVDSSDPDVGAPWQVGVDTPGGSELNINEEHSEGITWTTGGDLGISAGGLSIGGSVEVSESVSDAFGAGVTEPCPEGKWRCSAVITPSVMHVKGHLKLLGPDDGCEVSPTSRDDGGEDNKKFEFWIPIKDKSGNAKISIDVCTCQNRKNWADPGHPKLLCPEDCVDE